MTRIEINMISNGYIIAHNIDGVWIETHAKDYNEMLECVRNLKVKYEDKLI